MLCCDLGGYVSEARERIGRELRPPQGYTIVFSGQFEYWEKALPRLWMAGIITLLAIVLLLCISTKSWLRVVIVMLAVPFSLVCAFWFLWILDYNLSLGVVIGIIALAGLDAETGLVMLLYPWTTASSASARPAACAMPPTCSRPCTTAR